MPVELFAMAELKEVLVVVQTGIGRTCPIKDCEVYLDSTEGFGFEAACNHMLTDHSLTCVHVGTETEEGHDGNPWHLTVAVFGR